MPHAIFLLTTPRSKDDAALRSKTPTALRKSFKTRINFAAHGSLAIRAVQSAVNVPEK
jgi:hypothetical protein